MITKSDKTLVDDIIPKDLSKLKYVFILESPHIDEIRAGLPLIGDTGESVMKALGISVTDKINNFGKFVSLKRNDTAIMNISQCPLQSINKKGVEIKYIEDEDVRNFVRNNYVSIQHHRITKKYKYIPQNK